MKRYCEKCGRRLANMNKSELCFSCQPREIQRYTEYGTVGSHVNRAEYMRSWRSRKKAAAI